MRCYWQFNISKI